MLTPGIAMRSRRHTPSAGTAAAALRASPRSPSPGARSGAGEAPSGADRLLRAALLGHRTAWRRGALTTTPAATDVVQHRQAADLAGETTGW